MILEYRCLKCGNYYNLPFKAEDRGHIKMRGLIASKCPHCKFRQNLIVNDIRAIQSSTTRSSYSIALIFDIAVGLFLYFFERNLFINPSSNFAYYALVLFFFIPFLIAKVHVDNQMKMIKNFNSYYV